MNQSIDKYKEEKKEFDEIEGSTKIAYRRNIEVLYDMKDYVCRKLLIDYLYTMLKEENHEQDLTKKFMKESLDSKCILNNKEEGTEKVGTTRHLELMYDMKDYVCRELWFAYDRLLKDNRDLFSIIKKFMKIFLISECILSFK